MRNSSTSNLPLNSTTVSKICSIKCESIRWPSASTTSCCMGNIQDTVLWRDGREEEDLSADCAQFTEQGELGAGARGIRQAADVAGHDLARLAERAVGSRQTGVENRVPDFLVIV